MTEYRINVFENESDKNEIVSRVRYNTILDYWDGRNWTNGGVGRHKGITKLKDGRYVIIHGTQWQGESNYGLIATADDALQEILRAQKIELLDTKKFKELKELALKKGIIGDTEFDNDEEI